MLTIDKAVLLSEGEYDALREAARMYREYRLTRKEIDAIVYAIRMIKMADLMKSPDADSLAKTLSGVWKKMEGLDA